MPFPLPHGFFDPRPSILVAHGFPYTPDDARDVPVIRLDTRRNLLLRDKVAAEEDERVPRARDVAVRLLSGVRLFG
jgi:hypothetical protein